MNISKSKTPFLVAALLAVAASQARAQSLPPLTLRWFTIDCGGGLSTGGGYSLQSSFGQPDVEPQKRGVTAAATGGEITAASELGEVYLFGGYLPGAVAAISSPRLDIRRDGMTTVVLSWQVTPMDFFAMSTTNLHAAPDDWEFLFTDEIERAGDNWEMNLRTVGPARYFRLIPAWLTKR